MSVELALTRALTSKLTLSDCSATAELKALIAMLFYHFEARIVVHRETAEASSRFLPICFAGSDKQGWRPKPVDGRGEPGVDLSQASAC